MAGFFGADVEQLQMLGRELDQQAEELEAITSRLTTRIANVDWRGPDAQRFKSDWHERLANTLRATAGALREVSNKALQNARQQQEASGDGIGSRVPGGFTLPFNVSSSGGGDFGRPFTMPDPKGEPFRIPTDGDVPPFNLRDLQA